MRAHAETEPAGASTLGLSSLLGTAAIFSIFVNFLVLTGPLFMLQVYDRVLTSKSEETLAALLILVAVLYTFHGILDYLRGRILARIGARFDIKLSPSVFRATFSGGQKGADFPDAQQVSRHLDSIRQLASSQALLAVMDLPWTPVFLIAIFVFHPLLGWISLAGGAILIVAAALAQWTNRLAFRRSVLASSSANEIAAEASGAADFLRAQGIVGTISALWSKERSNAVRIGLALDDRSAKFAVFSKSARMFLQSAILAAGAWLVLQNALSAGAMIAVSVLLGRALAPVEAILSNWSILEQARTGWRCIKALQSRPETAEPPVRVARGTALIEVKNVTILNRETRESVLKAVSFSIEPGEAIGVIGNSGAGKSTLARAVTGQLHIAAGTVRIGNSRNTGGRAGRISDHVGYLPQDISFFRGTIRENIARMATDSALDAVISAAMTAGVHSRILDLPSGYETWISNATCDLPGGFRQQLGLARAIFGWPDILVLDEPNSALDADGSLALNQVVSECKSRGKAVLLMTHRPTAITVCDRLLVLENGRIVADGPRDDVLRSMISNVADIRTLPAGFG